MMARFSLANTNEIGLVANVFVNGKPVDRCVFADTKRGVARCYLIDERGRLMTSSNKDRPRMETLRGHVEVKDNDGNTLTPQIDHRYNPRSPFRRANFRSPVRAARP